uniref:C2H2-type domain-containing protein n=2 Tax=Plectus sambesii TaxID=2011161 RepID=A0A914VF50_9BILA
MWVELAGPFVHASCSRPANARPLKSARPALVAVGYPSTLLVCCRRRLSATARGALPKYGYSQLARPVATVDSPAQSLTPSSNKAGAVPLLSPSFVFGLRAWAIDGRADSSPNSDATLDFASFHHHHHRPFQAAVMPYRAELKRPDLKGQFPCSVCGKIFCHSSSLSRHRMQAHFKSYTCTQCNQEISSNETLRSHMFRAHGISRMFMCRCCNWAFPDKTSLHIHMQSMMRNGHPGDVSVLARSSTDGPGMAGGMPMGSPIEMDDGSPQSSPTGRAESCSPTGLPTMTPNAKGSIFPCLPTREELFTRLRERAGNGGSNGDSHSPTPLPASADVAGNGQWLANWLANNPFGSPALSGLAGMQQQLLRNSLLNKNCPLDEDDEGLEINCVDDTVTDESLLSEGKEDGEAVKVEPSSEIQSLSVQRSSIVGNPLNSLLYKKKLNNALRNKRKASAPRPLSSFLKAEREESGDGPPPAKVVIGKVENASEQPSPTASDSHTSGSNGPLSANGSDASGSPLKCFECQVTKGKLSLAENRNRFFESKVSSLESKVARLDNQIHGLEGTVRQYEVDQRELRRQCETFEGKLLECQEKAVQALACVHGGPESLGTVKLMLENLLESTTLFRNSKA